MLHRQPVYLQPGRYIYIMYKIKIWSKKIVTPSDYNGIADSNVLIHRHYWVGHGMLVPNKHVY